MQKYGPNFWTRCVRRRGTRTRRTVARPHGRTPDALRQKLAPAVWIRAAGLPARERLDFFRPARTPRNHRQCADDAQHRRPPRRRDFGHIRHRARGLVVDNF